MRVPTALTSKTAVPAVVVWEDAALARRMQEANAAKVRVTKKDRLDAVAAAMREKYSKLARCERVARFHKGNSAHD